MKTEAVKRDVEYSGMKEVRKFQMEVSAKSFNVVIKLLYPNPVRAIIRELWSNAYDSHAEAGHPEKPFTVHLPTQFDPVFTVRDYGVGMSHEHVMDIYSTVYKSTKENSNVPVGKYGLGSKTPFAYTDAFSLECWYDGTKRYYNCVMDSTGEPVVGLVHEEPTDEPNGVQVSFPVKQGDIYEFTSSATSVVQGFDVIPDFQGSASVSKYTENLSSGTGWRIPKNKWYQSNQSKARQGCVLYNIDPDNLGGITSNQKIILDMGLILDFEIGSVEPTPDREHLNYDEKTKKNILDRLDSVYEEMVNSFKTKFYACETRWEAAIVVSNFMKRVPNDTFKNSVISSLKWKGRHLDRNFQYIFPKFPTKNCSIAVPGDAGSLSSFRVFPQAKSSVASGVHKFVFYIMDDSSPVSYAYRRVRDHYESSKYKNSGCAGLFIRCDLSSTTIVRAWIALGKPPVEFVDVSKLDRPNFVRKPRKLVSVKALARGQYYPVDCSYSREDHLESEEEYYYLPMTRGSLDTTESFSKLTRTRVPVTGTLAEAFYTLLDHGFIKNASPDATLMIIPASTSAVLKQGKWVNFLDKLVEIFGSHEEKYLKTLYAQSQYRAEYWKFLEKLSEGVINKSDEMKELLSALDNRKSGLIHLGVAASQAGIVGTYKDQPDLYAKFEKKYYLAANYIFSMYNYVEDVKTDKLIDYINAVDEGKL